MSDVILAVVGSTQFAKDPTGILWATKKIRDRLADLRPDLVISGGAKGIDTLAKNVAIDDHYAVEEFLPQQRRWAPHGFMERNILIAERCTHLLCIRHHLSTTYGSGWTADRAASLGKVVERLMYDPMEV